MEFFGAIGFIFALIVWSKQEKLAARIKKIEAYLQEEGFVDREKESLRENLTKNTGRKVKLELSEEGMDFDIQNKECELLDIDEIWVLIRLTKKEEEYLVRIGNIKNVMFVIE